MRGGFDLKPESAASCGFMDMHSGASLNVEHSPCPFISPQPNTLLGFSASLSLQDI